MTPSASSVARGRYWVRVSVRVLSLGLILMGLQASATVLASAIAQNGSDLTFIAAYPMFWVTWISPFASYAGTALVLLLLQARIARWIMPFPRDECPQCGYSLAPESDRCPECGLNLARAGAATPSR